MIQEQEQIKPKQYLAPPSVYPGMTLAEILEARGISQTELALRANRPVQAVNEIIKGKKEITAETAIALEKILGIEASFWLQLERNYREALAREEELANLEKQVHLLSKYPYKEMVAFGWVKDTRDRRERVGELLRWLGLSHLGNLSSSYALAFRKSERFLLSKEKLAVWLRHGELEFQKIEFQHGVAEKPTVEFIKNIRALTTAPISQATQEAKRLCRENGIAFVLTPEFKGFPVSGVTRWNAGHPIIQLTLRYKCNDQLWFSFFHELGHVFLHNKRDLFIDLTNTTSSEPEDEANAFARDYLIPPQEYTDFLHMAAGYSNVASIRQFANRIGIAPGIVVGRLQHDRKLPMATALNRLKTKLMWVQGKSEA